jgi:hypothetical protein
VPRPRCRQTYLRQSLLSFRHLIWLQGIIVESALVNPFGQSAYTKGYRRGDSPVNMEAQQPVKHSFCCCQPIHYRLMRKSAYPCRNAKPVVNSTVDIKLPSCVEAQRHENTVNDWECEANR